MAKIERTTQKIFGGNAPTDDIAALGSFKTGTPVYTDNIEQLQNAAFEQGYSAALVANEAPYLEEQNSVPYVLSTQLAYLFQQGIPEYDEGTTYYIGNIIKILEDNIPALYYSLVDDNAGNPTTDETAWARLELGGGTGGTSLPLFTQVIQDHVLSFEESKGYALQGTYVYKEAASQRYGYPDFYNRCIAEKTAGTATQTTLGSTTITTYNNANGHIYYDIADKAAVDSYFASTGVADMYGVDEENERIFLPRNNWFTQLTTDTSKVNQYNKPGLPNITGTFRIGSTSFSADNITNGAFKQLSNTFGVNSGSNVLLNAVNFDAARSSALYGASNTVQPPSSNKLLYYVVGNTEQETALTAVTEITSSENDTIPLGFSCFQGVGTQPAAGWLASNGQWNSGKLYETFYNYYVPLIGQPFAGGYVRSYTDTYTNYDLVINQDDMTFRLPLMTKDQILIDEKEITENGSWYKLYSNGYLVQGAQEEDLNSTAKTITLPKAYASLDYQVLATNMTNATTATAKAIKVIRGNSTTQSFQMTIDGTGGWGGYWYSYGYANISPSDFKLQTLYFKVANAVQDLAILAGGEVTTALATKLSREDAAEIASWCVPDYTAGVSIAVTAGTNYIAPSAGFIVARYSQISAATNANFKITVNDVVVLDASGYTSMAFAVTSTAIVGKDDIITVAQNATNNSQLCFYPFKGTTIGG